MQTELPLPPTDTDLPFTMNVRCMHCDMQTATPLWVTKHFGHSTSQFPFCGESCANTFYLDRLRRSGL